jgi:RNA polymerase sigma factor for flagellar operon FliA
VNEDDRFVEEYRPLVIKLARRVHAELTLTCDLDDLIAFGFKGLVEARGRFDPSRGVQFNTFAYYRIRGAIIDGVREMAFMPRRAHARLKAAEAEQALTEELADGAAQAPAGRTPAEAAKAIDDTLHKLSASYVLASLGQSEDDHASTPESLLVAASHASEIRAAVDELPDRERALVTGFYFEGRQFDEVARELGISKSWASRLHTKALALLRESLAED